MSSITIFKDGYNTDNPHHISLQTALKRIQDGNSKETVDEIRRLKSLSENLSPTKQKTTEKQIANLKKSLPSVMFHGKFDKPVEKEYKSGAKKGEKYISYREDVSISEYSGLLILDFDKVDVHAKRLQLMADNYVYACWVSPSGNGLKAIVICPKKLDNHYNYYNAIIDRYPELDATSKSISRLCFESYDPDLYINPSAQQWSKTITEEKKVEVKKKQTERRNNKALDIAANMIRRSADGEKHNTLLKAAKYLGGYITTGRVNEDEAKNLLLNEVGAKGAADMGGAEKTIEDGFSYGKNQPLYETKKLEKLQEFVIRQDGSYDFIASNDDMDDYEQAFLNGTLEMGLTTGYPQLDEHWMLKKNTLVWIAGLDNTGKSFIMWYMATIAAMLHGWKVLIHSAENNDGQLRKKIKEFYLGKVLKDASKQELADSQKFFSDHFKIMTSKKMHTADDLLMKAEIVYDEGFEYEVLIADPFNSLDIPNGMDSYRHDVKACNSFRVFKENYSSVWIIDHIGTGAARNRDSNGKLKMPSKADVSGGNIKANKTDDFLIVYRDTKGEDWMYLQLSVDKIKDQETGGIPTQNESPIYIRMNPNKCGYTNADKDAVQQYWQRKGEVYSSGFNFENSNEFN